MGRDVLFTSIFQERAVTMGLADGTYSVLEDTVTSLQTLQFNSKSQSLLETRNQDTVIP